MHKANYKCSAEVLQLELELELAADHIRAPEPGPGVARQPRLLLAATLVCRNAAAYRAVLVVVLRKREHWAVLLGLEDSPPPQVAVGCCMDTGIGRIENL